MTLGVWLNKVRSQVPSSSGCLTYDKDDGCSFVDKFGIRNYFANADGKATGKWDRVLFTREQVRERGGWLPYGLRWSDTYVTAIEKLKPYGGRAEGTFIILDGCWPPPSIGYWVEFEFGPDGRLTKVSQAFQAY